MSLTTVRMRARKDKDSKRFEDVEFCIDSGAAMTVVPGAILRRLGIKPGEMLSSTLANGERITRDIGEAYFEFGQKKGYSKVVFGKPGDCNLLGSLTLGTFGLALDPFRREFKEIPMLLAALDDRSAA